MAICSNPYCRCPFTSRNSNSNMYCDQCLLAIQRCNILTQATNTLLQSRKN